MNIPLNIDWQQILLHLFNFIILAVGLYLLLYKPVKEFMEKRIGYYAGLDHEAKQKVQEAEQMKSNYQRQLAHVEQEIAEQRLTADKELETFREKEIARVKTTAETIMFEARKKAEKEREELIDESQDKIANMAISAAKKIIMDDISEERQKALFEDILRKAGGNCGS